MCLGSGVTAQETSPAAREREVIAIHPGLISGNIYTNTFFGFSLEIPPGWKPADNVALQAFAEKSKQRLAKLDPTLKQLASGDEVDSPLMLLGEIEPWKRGPHHRLIEILSTDVSVRSSQPSAEEFLNFVARLSAENDLSAKYDPTLEKVMLGGREFWKAHRTQSSSVVWHEAQFVTIEKKHVIQFILMSPDEQGLLMLEPIMRTLHFQVP